MKITILDVVLQSGIAYEMIGYSEEHLPIIEKVRKCRPDIDTTQLRMLTNPLEMTIFYKIKRQTYIKTLNYKVGFVFDTASIPNLLKWFIDNDGANMLIPSLYHDAGYGLNFDTRRFTDAMFRALARYYGNKYKVRFYRIKAFVAWVGPASPVGKKIYNGVAPEDHFNYGLCT